MPEKPKKEIPGERIAKVMARAGLASRREAEAWIAAGRVAVNGAVISSPALNVTTADRIAVDGQPLPRRERTRLFRYHKPRGLVTTNSDPEGRPTIFAALPKDLPRLISVGRLDINTEGLLLLTNDGGLARVLELPATAWLRRYRVRAKGRVMQPALDRLRSGLTVAGVHYGPIEATLDREQGANVWLTIGIREGKNREVRKVLETLDLQVNRLIRVTFGPFELGDLDDGDVKEIESQALRTELGEKIVAEAGADFEAPSIDHDALPRHPEVRAKRASKGHRKSAIADLRGKSWEPISGKPEIGGRSSFEARQGRAPQDDGSKVQRGRDRQKQPRRDRTGGPRPKYPR